MAAEFAFMDAVALAELVRRKEVQPAELVEAALFRLASQLESARPWVDKIPPTSHIPPAQ